MKLGTYLLAIFVASPLWAQAPGATPKPHPTAANLSLPLLTDLPAIRRLTPDQADDGYPVRVRGVATHYNPLAHMDLYISQGETGQYISWRFTQRLRQTFHPGDEVEVEGFTVKGGYAPDILPTSIHVVGKGPLPAPKQLPYPELATGRHNCQRIEISGVVQGAHFAKSEQTLLALDVAVTGGTVIVQAWDYKPEDLERFIDTRIRAVGVCGAARTSSGQFRAVLLRAGRTSDLIIEEPAPDVFAKPAQPIDTVLQYSSAGTTDHRIHVRGVVTAQQAGQILYIQDATSGMRLETARDVNGLHVGDIVEAAGFAAPTSSKPILRNVILRVTGPGKMPAPLELKQENTLDETRDAELVRLHGTLLGVLTSSAENALIIQAGNTVFNAFLPSGQASQDLRKYVTGSEIAVTGVYVFRADPPQSFQIVLRSPADIQLLKAAPWWTVQHTAVLLVVMVVAYAAYGWRVSTHKAHRRELERKVEERTADLSREVEERRRAEWSVQQENEQRRRAQEEARIAAELLAEGNRALTEQQQALAREVEEHRLAEEAAGRERDLLHALLDNIPDLIYFKDAESRFTRVNRAMAEAAGASDPVEMVGRTDADYFAADYARVSREDEQRLLKDAAPIAGKVDRDARTGRWYLATKVPLQTQAGQVVGLVGISKDITERREVEQKLERELQAFLSIVSAVAQGRLIARGAEGDETLGRIARAFNQMLAGFATILAEARDAAISVSGSSSEILAASTQIAKSARDGSDQAYTMLSAVEKMAASMSQVSSHADSSAEKARQVLAHVKESDRSVNTVFEGITRIDNAVSETAAKMVVLEQRSRRIGDITELIDDLSSQSRLLSLNAAIEAAHAGDAGRGFAIVADEIRRLADRSNKATADVAEILQAMVEETGAVLAAMKNATHEVKKGTALSETARRELLQISGLAEESVDLSSHISAASREQTRSSRTLAEAMQAIANITQESAAGANETARAVGHLVDLSEQLMRAIAVFHIEP